MEKDCKARVHLHAQQVSMDKLPAMHSASAVAEKIPLSEERLVELAEVGCMPCWYVDGEMLFQLADVKRYIAEHLLWVQEGAPPPKVHRVLTVDPLPPHEIPLPLRGIDQLREVACTTTMPCVYFLCDGQEVVYVGQSVNVVQRVTAHNTDKSFDRVFVLPCLKGHLDALEGAFIRAMKPKFNGRSPNGVSVAPAEIDDEGIMKHYNVELE